MASPWHASGSGRHGCQCDGGDARVDNKYAMKTIRNNMSGGAKETSEEDGTSQADRI